MQRTSVYLLVMLGWVAAASIRADEKSAPPFTQKEDVVFADVHGIGLLLDIFTPVGEKNGLAIVDVVSGSFFSDRGKLRAHVKFGVYDEFCAKGYTVFAVRPGSMTKFAIPEMADHVKMAIRWVRLNHEKFGVNTDRMGIVGASAGGHLASLVALTPDDGSPTSTDPLFRQSCRIQAAAVFFPPADFLAWGDINVDTNKTPGLPIMFKNIIFAGPAVPRSPERLKEQIMKISPAHQVKENSPPFLLIHGDADPIVPLQQSKIFFQRLKEKGVDAELIIKPGGEHPWPTLRDEVKIAVQWVDSKLRIDFAGKSASK